VKKWLWITLAVILIIISACIYIYWPKVNYAITGKLSIRSLQECKSSNICGWENANVKITGYLVKMDTTNYVLFDEPYSSSVDYEGLHIAYFEGYNSSLDKLKNHKVKIQGRIIGQAILGNNFSSIIPVLSVNSANDVAPVD
jgi:hypothetical protein